MTLDQIIAEGAAKAAKELYGADFAPESVVTQATRKDFEGNITVVVFHRHRLLGQPHCGRCALCLSGTGHSKPPEPLRQG